MNINQILVKTNATIKDTMRAIDKGAVKTVIIVDDSGTLCGLVTDGDIRRGILNGVGVNEQINTVMNKNPTHLKIGTTKEEIRACLKSKEITGVPLVNEQNIVKDFAFLSEHANLSYFNMRTVSKRHLQRILVIGGAGYIGSLLTRKLLAKGYKVTVLDKGIYGTESLDEIKTNPDLNIIIGDTRHIEDVTAAISDVDAVVHLAELVGDPACALSPASTQEINYFATRIIAEVCKHCQINRLVYASSCSVYGASTGDSLLTEESPLKPVSLYAKMKIASEHVLNEMQDSNFLPTILRFATVFGFSHRPRFDLVVNLLTAKAIKDGKITVFGGDQWRPNVHVSDIANTIISVLEAPIELVGGQVFNVGSEENNHTINEIGKMVRESVPSAKLVIEEKDIDKRDYKVNFSKIKKILNIQMKVSVKDGIKEIKKALQDCPTLDYCDKKFSNIKFLEHQLQNKFGN